MEKHKINFTIFILLNTQQATRRGKGTESLFRFSFKKFSPEFNWQLNYNLNSTQLKLSLLQGYTQLYIWRVDMFGFPIYETFENSRQYLQQGSWIRPTDHTGKQRASNEELTKNATKNQAYKWAKTRAHMMGKAKVGWIPNMPTMGILVQSQLNIHFKVNYKYISKLCISRVYKL